MTKESKPKKLVKGYVCDINLSLCRKHYLTFDPCSTALLDNPSNVHFSLM